MRLLLTIALAAAVVAPASAYAADVPAGDKAPADKPLGDWLTGYADPTDGKLVLPDTRTGRMLATRPAYRGISFIFPVANGRFHAIEYTELTGLTDFRNRWRRNHMGTDIFGPVGRPIFAAAPGVVTVATFTPKKGPGAKVAIYHGRGVYTYYLHMSAVYCEEGQEVEAGDVIAAVGASGNARGTPPHLHFEIDVAVETQDKPAWFVNYVNDPRPGVSALRSVEPLAYVCKHAPRLRDRRPLARP
ncbi:MAG: M23 family metallopeptidase [Candidatus Zixiibacteriota bacterium]